MPITINLDRLVDAMLDLRTPHYWDQKSKKIVRGSSDLEDEKARRVLIETIGKRKFKQLTDGFARTLDETDAKAVREALKTSFDKFNRLLNKSPELKKAFLHYAVDDLIEAAQDWLVLQGIDEFIATGELARYAMEGAEEDQEEEADKEDEDEDDEEEEESDEEAEDEEEEEDEDELEEELDEEDEEFDEELERPGDEE